MKNPWQTLTTTIVYDNPWIQITHRDVINPNGGKGIYGVVHFKNVAIGIIPLDENNNTWLIGQYRYTLEEYTWEIPEGGGPHGEDPLDAAKRELLEEAGIVAEEWTKVLDMQTSNSVTDEVAIGYVARGLTFTEAEPEDTEDLTIKKVPFEVVVNMVMRGEIKDAFSIATILKTKLLLDNGKL